MDVDVVLANELPRPSAISALPMSVAMPQPMVHPAEHNAAIRSGDERLRALETQFAARAKPVQIIRFDEFASVMGGAVAGAARTHNMFVCTLPGQERDFELSGTIMDRVLVEGGRGVIGVPAAYEGGHPIHNIAVAWNSSRESARADAEAIPLLTRAEAVVVLLVDQLRRAGTDTRPGDDVLLYLTRHGVKAKVARVAKETLKTSEAILAEAKRQNADLLVMGAQAEGGVLQWLRGSVSRDLVSKTFLPLLMAH